ncbi:hypothetical protein [Pedobacter nyackensis]|uniref:Uncharacterized protein n=1 Tax=Pedobacter nyackensis TaxID=475255 RepID=A0A1W2AIU4_9SPHI|nr:hypothetical protein [Pedobacter nyackensis]SMC60432.1 hypothetical protein SAMN04488101_101644 [Pedobacter nyackensis]
MLVLQDATDRTEHSFTLTDVTGVNQKEFTLTSATYPGLNIQFTLDPPAQALPTGYTVSVHLFKNPFHTQGQIIDLRSADRSEGNGRIGYLFSLEALFTPGALQLDPHRYCYAYFGIQYIFENVATIQTKDADIKADPYSIMDFFDSDTIILVLCNEFCNDINNFNFQNYLPNLFLSGFTFFSKNSLIETLNDNTYLKNKFDSYTVTTPPILNGIYPFRLEKAKISICSEAYVIHLFTNLIQKKFDQVTRFLMIYQVIEIFMPKMIHLEVQQRVCNDLYSLTTDKVKELVIGLTKQGELITALFARHAIPSNELSNLLRQEILDFFIHVNHPEFQDQAKNIGLSLTDLFYAFRNKIVHEYRILHENGVDHEVTKSRIDTINHLSEALVAETITVFVG